MANGLDELLRVQQTALRVREERQGLLASNIANADTPNYKARDINFSDALKRASKTRQSTGAAIPLAVTAGAHLSGKSTRAANTVNGVAVQYRNDQQGRIDGNNVDTDYERMQFADNAVRYEASVTLVSGQIRSMLAVIQG